MTQHKATTSHNYIVKMERLIAAGLLNDTSEIDVRHDNWCDAYKGRFCNCDPEIKIRRKPQQIS